MKKKHREPSPKSRQGISTDPFVAIRLSSAAEMLNIWPDARIDDRLIRPVVRRNGVAFLIWRCDHTYSDLSLVVKFKQMVPIGSESFRGISTAEGHQMLNPYHQPGRRPKWLDSVIQAGLVRD